MKLPRGIKNSQKHLSRMLNDNITSDAPAEESHFHATWYVTFLAVAVLSLLIAFSLKSQMDDNESGHTASEPMNADLQKEKSKIIPNAVSDEEKLDALVVSANELYNNEQYDDALDLYTKIIRQLPSDAEMYANRGNAHFSLGDYNSALSDYFKSTGLDSTQGYVYSNIGLAYEHLGRYEKSVSNFDVAIRLNPENVNEYFNRAQIHMARLDSFRALADYNKVIELDATRGDAYYYRGYIQYGFGLYIAAASDFSMMIRFNPDNLDSYLMKGVAESLSGKLDKSITTLSLLIEKAEYPTDIFDAYYYRANVYYIDENYRNAISDYTSALNVDLESHDPYLYLYRSDAYNKIGNAYMANLDMERYNELVAE